MIPIDENWLLKFSLIEEANNDEKRIITFCLDSLHNILATYRFKKVCIFTYIKFKINELGISECHLLLLMGIFDYFYES